MSIVLSKKGFDSSTGGMYMPMNGKTGEYAYLFRPEDKTDSKYKGVPYEAIPTNFYGLKNMKEVLEMKNKYKNPIAHVDPDLLNFRPNLREWKPTYGQKGAALGYLKYRGVGENSKGSIFLFFNRFKPWKNNGNTLTEGYYIYGWLQVGETVIPSKISNKEWHPINYHPHFSSIYTKDNNNLVYIASDKLFNKDIPGAGMFKKLSGEVRLSINDKKELLKWCLPIEAYKSFSRLKDYSKIDDKYCLVYWPQGYGQEAICPGDMQGVSDITIKKLREWAIDIIKKGITKGDGIKSKFL